MVFVIQDICIHSLKYNFVKINLHCHDIIKFQCHISYQICQYISYVGNIYFDYNSNIWKNLFIAKLFPFHSTNIQSILQQINFFQDRSIVISTYALCGFANLSSIGMVMGALGSMAESRRSEIAEMALRAMIVGNVVCFMNACTAGWYSIMLKS